MTYVEPWIFLSESQRLLTPTALSWALENKRGQNPKCSLVPKRRCPKLKIFLGRKRISTSIKILKFVFAALPNSLRLKSRSADVARSASAADSARAACSGCLTAFFWESPKKDSNPWPSGYREKSLSVLTSTKYSCLFSYVQKILETTDPSEIDTSVNY